ncbi:cell division protein ZapE [Agarivorans sp. 1_MG-2023]|uniref:cell division protein ZapE n=1 Tax=Agarivorans sp. 1_MG-2023 TaxID=3062634 RepID=UPI0026E36C9B|nr:cell division protein ZapE [Agarivorans sp. 1_MG-2023]MDO6764576.1 cell division protein ZapE [Agarivorans sp. 1_MG-2023]
MTPQLQYEQDLQRDDFVKDNAQAFAVAQLQRVYEQLSDKPALTLSKPSLFGKLKARFSRSQEVARQQSVQGLYMWGGVGRGKTYLMDTFFNCLPQQRKMRVHFHRFMQRVHHELKTLDGQSNPLEIVADRLITEAEVICFDEFFVSDITDAMLLGTLFEALFERGVTLVATSNIPPEDLYRNGLQRQRFMPTIKLIQQHCQILNVDGGSDYRMRTLNEAEIYHYPLDKQAEQNLAQYFLQLSNEPRQQLGQIEINQRMINFVNEADSVLHIEFAELCEGARSQLDYIELARLYHTVLLSGVVAMGAKNDDAARRFIALIDEFYERNVTLIIAAEVALEKLYKGGRLSFEFERCLSRLQEMQSHEYLEREHLP